MDIKEAYKIHSIVEEINKTNKEIEMVGEALININKFKAGQIDLGGGDCYYKISIDKNHIEPLLDSYSQYLKENNKRKLDELMYIEVKSEIKPENLNEFYMELNRIHLEYKPQWRFGQFMHNFFNWVYTKKLKDIFYIEEDEMIKLLKEYVGEK
jgi:hypothetical protein